MRFAAAGRHCGHDHADAVRTLLLVEARSGAETLTRLHRHGSAAERRAVLKCLFTGVPVDAPVRGSHGRRPTSDDEGPLVLVSTPRAVSGRVAATEVKSLLLRLAGLS